jgi:membrane protein
MKAQTKEKWKAKGKLAYIVYRQGMKDDVFTTASSMVYSTLMAMVPAFAFVYAFFGAFGVLQTFITELSGLFQQLFGAEASLQIISLLDKYTGNAMSLGVIGLLSFLYTMVLLMNKIWTQVNLIFHTSIDRNLVKRITGFVTFLILAVVLGAAYIVVQGKLNTWYNQLLGIQSQGWSRFIGILTPRLITFVALLFICMAVPNVKVQGKAALYAALLGTVVMFIANSILSSLSSMVVRYSIIYGSVASLFLSLFWMYMFWVITFWSVEFAYVYQFRPDLQKFKGLPQSPALQLSEGMDVMMLIGSNFREGKGATTIKEMVSRLSIPESRLYGFLDLLSHLKFIMPTNNGHTEYVVARPLEDLKVQEMVTALYGLEVFSTDDHETAGEAVACQVKDHGISSLGSLTIENLLQRV